MVSGGKTARSGAKLRRARLQGSNALLQSGADTAQPSSRVLVWHSHLTHQASRHRSLIDGHSFNQQLEVCLPTAAGSSTAQSLQWETGFYYEIRASLAMFLSPAFIREYIASGAVYMATKNTAVDASQSAMLLPSGQLLLLVDSEMYQQLGLRYVITLDLKSSAFAEEGENVFRDRVLKCLDKLEDVEMLLCAYNERGSARTILFGDDDSVPRSRVELNGKTTTIRDVFLPKFYEFYAELGAESVDGEDALRDSLQEAYDWLGLVACRLTDLLQRQKPEEYVSTFTGIPDLFECEPDSQVSTVRWRGLLAAPFCSTVIEKVMRAVKSGELPWAAVMIWGFPDTFVSWVQPVKTKNHKTKDDTQRREHGYLGNGSNNYTLLLLPNDEYFLLQALGPHDGTV
ncbi:hypothetical protein BBJ29_002109 [Phytophthora kernoviae]|uniref:Uncharacterized protein n=1 Tax=Phytophthora kernoviae TaxID=325452 RepID=A0A3F2RYA6_9STRA|nr:hypothetical protein BBJ29_002109 [Phytophthora kernoviae]RLN66547.1 hypothetical protein BBP00_00002167 [Phytophthora kernoviae]